MLEKLTRPSPATVISLVALVIALGGSAYSATATLVKITNAAGVGVAFVDKDGRLQPGSALLFAG